MKSKGEIIAEQIPHSAIHILDIGHAQLPNSHLLRSDRKVYGLDVVESHPEGYENIFVVDLNYEKLPFEDSGLDAVAMGCVLAHVANPLRVLTEINRVLPAGGRLVLTSPNPNYYWENVLNIFYNTFKKRVVKAKHYEHFFEFSRYNLRTSAERTGFKLVDEIGITFALVKTSVRFHPFNFPGLAYEICYVLEKTGAPQEYTTFENKEGIHNVPTKFF